MVATTYEQRIIEHSQDITAETDPVVMFKRARMLGGDFKAAELDDVHAAMMASLNAIVVAAWCDDREGTSSVDATLCAAMEAVIVRAVLLVRLALEQHGDDLSVSAHPIPVALDGDFGWQDGEEPEILPLAE